MVSGCNQDMLKSKKKRTFNSRYNNRKRVRGQNPLSNILWYLGFLLFSICACNKKQVSTFVFRFLECLQIRLQTFQFQHHKKLNRQWLCFASQICSHQVYLKFLLVLSTLLSQNSTQEGTHPKQHQKQHAKIQPWRQAPLLQQPKQHPPNTRLKNSTVFWEVRTPTSYRYPLSRKKALCLCIFACIYKHRLHCVQNDVFVRVRGWNFWGFPRSHLFATVQRRNAEKRTSALLDTKKMTSHKTHKTHPNGLPLTLDMSEKPTRSEAHTHKSPQARPCRRPLRTAAWTETLRAHFVPKWAAKQANSTCNPQNDALRHDFPRQAWFQFPAILSLFTGCRTNLRRLLGHLQHHPKSVRRRQ